jgi:hypothetical protein
MTPIAGEAIRKAGRSAGLVALAMTVGLAAAEAESEIELAVVVNLQNRAQISPAELENIFLLRRRQWSDGVPIVPFNYPPGDATRNAFDRAALRMSVDEAARYWLDQRIRSGTRAPRQLGDGGLAVRLVGRLPGAIAYVPAGMVNGSVRVVARIRGGRVVPP